MVSPHDHTLFENGGKFDNGGAQRWQFHWWKLGKQAGYSSLKRIGVFILAINFIPLSKSGLESLLNTIPCQIDAAIPSVGSNFVSSSTEMNENYSLQQWYAQYNFNDFLGEDLCGVWHRRRDSSVRFHHHQIWWIMDPRSSFAFDIWLTFLSTSWHLFLQQVSCWSILTSFKNTITLNKL